MKISRKGIILAGGLGSRLYPITFATSKQALPIYNKPLIYYSLSTLLLCGIKDIAIVTNTENLKVFKKMLGDGSRIGIKLTYFSQKKPEGLPQAFKICKNFIKDHPSTLILGDNIFYGHHLPELLKKCSANHDEASIFTYKVSDPENFGVAYLNKDNSIIDIKEKPKKPKSNSIVTGIYFVPPGVNKFVNRLKKSKRGEYEIIDLLKIYLEKKKLNNISLGRGYVWFDAGTNENMNVASNFVRNIETIQKHQIGNIDEIAYNIGLIDKKKLKKTYMLMNKSTYAEYLMNIINET